MKKNFPGDPVVKDLLYEAGDTGSIPGRGAKTPHAAEHPGPRAATSEATHHSWSRGPRSAGQRDSDTETRVCVGQSPARASPYL